MNEDEIEKYKNENVCLEYKLSDSTCSFECNIKNVIGNVAIIRFNNGNEDAIFSKKIIKINLLTHQ